MGLRPMAFGSGPKALKESQLEKDIFKKLTMKNDTLFVFYCIC